MGMLTFALAAIAPFGFTSQTAFATSETIPSEPVVASEGTESLPDASPEIIALRIVPQEPALWGRAASQQFVVLGDFGDGLERDVTSQSRLAVSDPGLAEIDESGKLTALAEGRLELEVAFGGQSARARVRIEGVNEQRPFSFARDIGGLLTKHGCNAVDCHGSVKGRGGFKLSLNVLKPQADYEWITKGGVYQVLTEEVEGGRVPRIDLDEPERSLLLLKPTFEVEHEGGKRLRKDSEDYAKIREWIARGAPYEEEGSGAHRIERIEVYPRLTALKPDTSRQLVVTAYLSDGRTEDLTGDVHYEVVNREVAKVSSTGVVQTRGKGETTLVVRAAGHAVNARVGVIGEPVPDYPVLEQRNFIDEHVFAKLKKFNIPPSGPATDAEFLRRVCLDLTGTLPPAGRVREFLADTNPDKRDRLIDVLLNTPEYVNYWTYRFADLFRVSYFHQSSNKRAEMYWHWIRESVANNKPFDQMARERIGGQGFNGPTRHYHHGGGEMPLPSNEMAENVVLFMGRRLDCAQCHDHPYESWTQDQFWGMTAFWGRLTRLGWSGSLMVHFDDPEGHGEIGQGERVIHPRRKLEVAPSFLDGRALAEDKRHDPRRHLADWMTSHPHFAESTANRIWSYFFGRGLVDPVDDFRSTNMATHPELLEALAQRFRRNGHDLKDLMREICRSNAYQMSGVPTGANLDDELNYSWSRPRALDAEVLFDAIAQVTEAYGDFGEAHTQRRAITLICPDRHPLHVLDIYGQPDRSVIPDRKNERNMEQALHVFAGATYTDKIKKEGGRVERLLGAGASDRELIEEFYLAALSRFPEESESDQLEAMLERQADRGKAVEDLVWGILSSPEFAYNH